MLLGLSREFGQTERGRQLENDAKCALELADQLKNHETKELVRAPFSGTHIFGMRVSRTHQ